MTHLKVEDTKCKTVYKNAYSTALETQCTPTFETKARQIRNLGIEKPLNIVFNHVGCKILITDFCKVLLCLVAYALN
jgi:hypothetical protein